MSNVVSGLLAQTTGGNLPAGKALLMILFFGAVGLISLFGLVASNQSLESMSGIIGTKNPRVARLVCGIGVVVGGFAVFVSALSLLGKL